MPITALQLTNLGPFEDIACTFDEHVNVFAGPNNSGKSTMLAALGNLIVYPFELPRKLLRQAPARFTVRYAGRHGTPAELQGVLPLDQEHGTNQQAWETMLLELGYTAFIPALRQSTGSRSLGAGMPRPGWRSSGETVAASATATSQDEQRAMPEALRRRRGLFPSNAGLLRDTVAVESLVELNSLAYSWNDPALHGLIAKVAAITSDVTEGFSIRFLRVAEDQDGLFPLFRTPDGDVPLNVLSQGTQSVMQWLAYLLAGYAKFYGYPSNLAAQPGVVIIDEIDAHLHPASQRRIIPALRRHFPCLQLLCSTHSPLMLAGLKSSQIQLLKRNEHGKVMVSRNETDMVGWSADEILRGLLGVTNPTDIETDARLGRLQDLQRQESLSPEETAEAEQLRDLVRRTLFGAALVTPTAPAEDAVTPPPKVATSAKSQAPKKSRAKPATGKATSTPATRRTSKTKK